MKYNYFGNTTLRVNSLLKNIESQLILFKELISQYGENLKWEDGEGQLQELYGRGMIDLGLVYHKDVPNVETICKVARQKSAPIENFGLVNRTQVSVTELGHEFLAILSEQDINGTSAQDLNEVLQIEYSSMFMLKLFARYEKSNGVSGLLEDYLDVFRYHDGYLNEYQFSLLPLVRTCNLSIFCENLKNVNSRESLRTFVRSILPADYTYSSKLQQIRQDWNAGALGQSNDYFHSSKGDRFVSELVDVCNYFYESYNSSSSITRFEYLMEENKKFKDHFVRSISSMKVIRKNYAAIKKEIDEYIASSYGDDFIASFYRDFEAFRVEQNLKDYKDLNRRYLKTTDCFEFDGFACKLSDLFHTLIKAAGVKEVITSISDVKVNKSSLIELTFSDAYQKILKDNGCNSFKELKEKEIIRKRQKIKHLLKSKFTIQRLTSEIMPLFMTRSKDIHKTDEKLAKLISPEATGPTCFEYIVALAFCHLNNGDPDILLNAGLSLDSQLLPKSHAVGGSGDIEIKYNDHIVLVEATLTESQNQRRAEMEPVTRHLGNLLVKISEPKIRRESYAIFVAPFLDKNVLNDFRARRSMPWENGSSVIPGMNIASLSVNDLAALLDCGKSYGWIRNKIKASFNTDENLRGSLWYQDVLKKSLDL